MDQENNQINKNSEENIPVLDVSQDKVVQNFKKYMEDKNTSVSIAAIKALKDVVSNSTSITKSGLQKELKTSVNILVTEFSHSISLTSGCELFTNFITKTDSNDFNKYKSEIIERAEKFLNRSNSSRERIGTLFVDNNFINDDSVILVHGYSRVVFTILSRAVNEKKKRFSVIMTESKNDENSKFIMANKLKELDIPFKVIMDCAVAHVMPTVDICLFGCEGVVENGGVINVIGTFQIAIVAKAHKKPVYVSSESFKFVRLFPLGQNDVPKPKIPLKKIETGSDNVSVEIENFNHDYTPPEYITLLFTELGILTPSAVSDELIKLYY